MTLALATQTAIAFNDRDENLDRDDGPVPQPVRSNAPSQFARFVDDEIRAGSIEPDMRILKERARTWLRNDEPGLALNEAWLESKTCGLVSFTRAFVRSYNGFKTGAAAPF
ncbi:hypothetical protein BTH42_00560 [Burkholderia sp. SRS-W-2-2016]|uniref:hypothetical protein n=1 Tax=Burkholderia sp. SRS-W-2-2016 TaxID=1926878 RepID=UPI00094AF5C2|nr:hypothetical protein [Burkholderia sp. SRS-W-2-2016]OLL33521.1 hypothetical protein BTH42_00560 [Burkholderia sp. SRS-W-2-2016]